MEIRKIIHIDMDAFFASVEQRDDPDLRGRPVIVGGTPDKRGVVAACSYEARKFGIHSAMSSARAYRLCPSAIFLRPRFDVYREVSQRIMNILRAFTELVEPLSLDEAYLDVTGSMQCRGSAVLMAKEIKKRIQEETALTASAGVSYNKFLAKIASDMDKPDGLYVIAPGEGEAFVEQLPIGRFHGIGRATEARMKALDIHTGADLKRLSREYLAHHFGKAGHYYYNIARAVDGRPVVNSRERKSIGSETTLLEDLDDVAAMLDILVSLAGKVMDDMQKRSLTARTVTVKIKYDNFQQITRSYSVPDSFRDFDEIKAVLPELLQKTEAGRRKVRLLGVSVSNLRETKATEVKEEQLGLI